MTTRREARECVVQILFELDMNPRAVDAALQDFWREKEIAARARDFIGSHVRGVIDAREETDALIRRSARNWALHRMGCIDRNVMRMAVYEMLRCPDIPAAVSINEAVDIAKYFSSAESGSFVNGILDRIRKDLGRT